MTAKCINDKKSCACTESYPTSFEKDKLISYKPASINLQKSMKCLLCT